MISKGYLLDTNIIIGLFVNDANIIRFLNQAAIDKIEIRISTMTECEIFSGDLSKSDHIEISFLNTQRYIDINSKIARLAGKIRREQKLNGRKLKAPDALIIATAIEHELTVVSRDSDMSFITKEYDLKLINL